MRLTRFLAANWRRERDSNPCGRVPKRFSRPPRYDHFDIPPYMNCRSADFIGYSIFLEIFLEMLFSVAFGSARKVSVYKAFLRFCDRYARKFSRPVPFPQYSRNARLAQQVFISPYCGDTLASKTHRVFSTSLTRYDRFDMPPYRGIIPQPQVFVKDKMEKGRENRVLCLFLTFFRGGIFGS